MNKIFNFATALCFAFASSVSNAESLPGTGTPTFNTATLDDAAKIGQLLANYTSSVSSGNRVQFESQLLALDIPFSGIGKQTLEPKKSLGLKAVQDYQGFRKAIFDSGQRFRQRFSNVKIEQVGNLAQVSLDYETTLEGQDYSGKGWKVLQLIKYDGQWKIASEFFTGYPAS